LRGSFLPDASPTAAGEAHEDVPDPYHGGQSGFDHVLNLLEAALPRLLETLCPQPQAAR